MRAAISKKCRENRNVITGQVPNLGHPDVNVEYTFLGHTLDELKKLHCKKTSLLNSMPIKMIKENQGQETFKDI